MRASLKKKKKKERFSFKKCKGEKAQQSWEDTAAKQNNDKDGVRNKDKRKGRNKTRVEQDTDQTNVHNRGCH